jgi:hypothetical protein
MTLQSFSCNLATFQFLDSYTAGKTQPITRPLSTHRTTQTQKKRIQTSMPRVRFKPMIPLFERAKKVHALVRAAPGISYTEYQNNNH